LLAAHTLTSVSPTRRKRTPPRRTHVAPQVRTGPSPDDEHDIVYFRRHMADDPSQRCPAREFIDACPVGVRAKFRAVLVAVATAPPKRFTGGGYWEAMKGELSGWFEVRVDGPGRHHYRLFCLLDYEADGRDKPLLVIVTGLDKPFRTEFADSDYARVRALGEECRKRNPRSVV
jgi:hypothetical protein